MCAADARSVCDSYVLVYRRIRTTEPRPASPLFNHQIFKEIANKTVVEQIEADNVLVAIDGPSHVQLCLPH